MSRTVKAEHREVPPEEIQRRVAEYRRLGYEHRAPAIMVYPLDQHRCPWPGCETRIAGVRFNLEAWSDPQLRERLLLSFWQGPGLIGRCPGCGRHVLFGYEVKQAIPDLAGYESALLPENWLDKAYLSPPANTRS